MATKLEKISFTNSENFHTLKKLQTPTVPYQNSSLPPKIFLKLPFSLSLSLSLFQNSHNFFQVHGGPLPLIVIATTTTTGDGSFFSFSDRPTLSISQFAQTHTQMVQTLSISRFSLSRVVVFISQISKSLSFLSLSLSSVVYVDLWVCGVCQFLGVRISALKFYFTMLCMILCMTLCYK